jgi:hypothetical protein
MALGKTSEFRTRAFAVALVVIACAATPASAQWGDRGGLGYQGSGGWGWDNRPSGGWEGQWQKSSQRQEGCGGKICNQLTRQRTGRAAPIL